MVKEIIENCGGIPGKKWEKFTGMGKKFQKNGEEILGKWNKDPEIMKLHDKRRV